MNVAPDSLAESAGRNPLGRVGESAELLLPVCLLPQLPQAILMVTPPWPVFVEKHNPGEIGLSQPLALLPQARLLTS